VPRLEIAAIAAAELSDAYDWYESQVPGLGDHLLGEFEAACDRIAEHPLHYQLAIRGTRRVSLQRFPYGIFYRLKDDLIIVTAFFHARRDPKRLLGR
jgi:plasmid stabilization system protein ParE